MKVRIKMIHKWEEVAGDYRRLQNEEFRNLYTSSNIFRAIK